MAKPLLHTMTPVNSAYAYIAFRDAAAGGGTPPSWTECGDDPQSWQSPPDAAGGLLMWDENGAPSRAEPPCQDLGTVAERTLKDLGAAGLTEELFPGVIRASYASCGGRVVALLHQPDGCWWVCVFRTESDHRVGASERNIRDEWRLGPTWVNDLC